MQVARNILAPNQRNWVSTAIVNRNKADSSTKSEELSCYSCAHMKFGFHGWFCCGSHLYVEGVVSGHAWYSCVTYSDDLALVTRLGHRLTFLKSNVTLVNTYIYPGVFAVALSKPVPEPDGWFVRGRRVECAGMAVLWGSLILHIDGRTRKKTVCYLNNRRCRSLVTAS